MGLWNLVYPLAAGVLLLPAVFPPVSQDAGEGLEAELHILPEQPLRGLPVAAIVTLRNRGQEPVKFVTFQLGTVGLGLHLRDPSGASAKISARISPASLDQWEVLPPGKTFVRKEWVFCCPRQGESHLATSGEYEITGEVRPFAGKEGRLSIGTSFKVEEPDESERAAAALFDHPRIPYLFWPGKTPTTESSEALGRLEVLAEKHADTSYGRHARYILAGTLAYRAMHTNFPNDSATEKDEAMRELRRAVELLETLLEDGPPKSLENEVRLDLGRFLSRLERKADASAAVAPLAILELPEPLKSQYDRLLSELDGQTPRDGR